MQIWAGSEKSALPICNYSQILYQFLTFTQNLKRSQNFLHNTKPEVYLFEDTLPAFLFYHLLNNRLLFIPVPARLLRSAQWYRNHTLIHSHTSHRTENLP